MAREALDLDGAAAKFAALRQPETPSEVGSSETPSDNPSEKGAAETKEEPTSEGLLTQPEPEAEEASGETREVEADTQADELTLDAEQLSHLLGIEQDRIVVDDSGKVKFKTKVDGEESDATLAEAIERYQRDANLTNRSKELAKLREQSQSKLNELVERSQQIAQQHQQLYQTLEKEFLKPFERVDWNDLRATDPAEYAAKKEELRDAQGAFRKAFEEVGRTLTESWQKTQKDIQERQQAYLAEQAEMVKKFVPGFNETVQNGIRGFLMSEGFSEQEIANVMDARVVKLAHMAMQFSQGQKKVKESLRKPLPRVLKPGAKPSPSSIRGETVKQLKSALKKSGHINDAVALFRATKEK